jgi:hypothetical protein
MSVKNHVSLNATASGTSQHSTINVQSIFHIANDGANNITFNFEDDITGTGSTGSNFVINAGEVMEDIDQSVGDLYYIATGGDTAFRLFGKAR